MGTFLTSPLNSNSALPPLIDNACTHYLMSLCRTPFRNNHTYNGDNGSSQRLALQACSGCVMAHVPLQYVESIMPSQLSLPPVNIVTVYCTVVHTVNHRQRCTGADTRWKLHRSTSDCSWRRSRNSSNYRSMPEQAPSPMVTLPLASFRPTTRTRVGALTTRALSDGDCS